MRRGLGALPSNDNMVNSYYGLYKNIKLPKTFSISMLVRDQKDRDMSPAYAVAAIASKYYNIPMSPQWIFNHREGEFQSAAEALEILRVYGIVPESVYRIDEHNDTPDTIDKGLCDLAMNYTIDMFLRIDTIDELKEALYRWGPCIITFPIYNYSNKPWLSKNYRYRIGYQTMCVVGYDRKGFRIMNSWGKKWGDSGFTHYPYAQFGMHHDLFAVKPNIVLEHKKCEIL